MFTAHSTAANNPGAAVSQSLAQLLPVLLLAGGGFAVYKILTKS